MLANSEINANLCQPITANETTEPGFEPEESRNPCEMLTINEKLIAESKAAIDCNRWDKERWDEALQRLSTLSQEARKWIFENGNHEKLQQCPLPNLECGETTKERLVELLNSIYPDQENSRSDISGFSLSSAAPIFSKYFSDINLSECRQAQEETKTEYESTLMLSRSTSLDMESDDILATSLPSSLFLKDIHSPECPGAEDSVAEFCPKYDIDLTPRFQSEYVSTVNPTFSSCIEDTGSSKCPNIQAENSLSKHTLADDPLCTATPNDELDNSSSCLRDTNSSTRVEAERNVAELLPKSYAGVSTHVQAENLSSVSSTSSFYLQDLSLPKGALKTTTSTEKCRRLRAIRKEAKNQRRLHEETAAPSTALLVQQQLEESSESTQITFSKEKLVKFQTKPPDKEGEEATKPSDADCCVTSMTLVDKCQNNVDDHDVFIDNHSQFRVRRLPCSLKKSCRKIVAYAFTGFIAFIILTSFSSVRTNTINHYTDAKIAKARDIVMDVGIWCRDHVAVIENLVKETPIFRNLPLTIAPGKDYPGSKFSKARDMVVDVGLWCRDQVDKSVFHVVALEMFVTKTSIFQNLPLKIASAMEYIGAIFFKGRGIALDVGRWCRDQMDTYAFPDAVVENFVKETPILQNMTVSIASADDDTGAKISMEQDAALET